MGAICLDCLEEFYTDADELIGYPTLDTSPISIEDNISDWLRNFGYLYESLAAFQMKTVNLMSYKAFLEKHSGHRIYSSDYDGEPDEIIAELDKARDQDLITVFKYDTSEFSELFYEIECKTCHVTTRLDHDTPVKILPFETTKLDVEEQRKFFERILDYDSANDNYIYSYELLWSDDYFNNLYVFMEKHLGHELYAKCTSSFDTSCNILKYDDIVNVAEEREKYFNFKARVEHLLLEKTVEIIKDEYKKEDLILSDDSYENHARMFLSGIREKILKTHRNIDDISDEHIINEFIDTVYED